MKLSKQVQSLQPAHHRYDWTRPGANKLTINDSLVSQPVAEMTLVFSILVIVRIDIV